MSNRKNIRIVKGSSKYKGAQDFDVSLQPLLTSEKRTLIQGDRNRVLNVVDQFNLERDYSQQYRMYGKIDVLFENIITGETSDSDFLESMYFLPDYLGCTNPPCIGLPPSRTFDFVPTKEFGPTTKTFNYNDIVAYQDNWLLYMSYVYSADTNQHMEYYTDYNLGQGVKFVSRDGIPFKSEKTKEQGKEVLRLTTPVPHGLTPGEYIELQPQIPGQTASMGGIDFIGSVETQLVVFGSLINKTQIQFEVDFLGNGLVNSEKYVININTRGLINATINSAGGTPFPTFGVGVLKRFVNPDNPETKCEYYTHQHKLITNARDYTLGRTGFEDGIYNNKGRVFKSRKTPPGYGGKTVMVEEFKSFIWSVTEDIDRSQYFDNLNRPVIDLYLSIFASNRNLIWDYNAGNSPCGYGWGWNFRKDGTVDPFIDNATNPTNIVQTNNNGVDPLPLSGSTYRGAFVEYNPYGLKERIVSEIGHSLRFNTDTLNSGSPSSLQIQSKYKYQPHHRIPIRKLSTGINFNDELFTSPQYSVYSLVEGNFRWRPLLPVGYFEEETNGVTYPYLNDAHYPSHTLEFMIEPVGPILALPEYSANTINMSNMYLDGCQ